MPLRRKKPFTKSRKKVFSTRQRSAVTTLAKKAIRSTSEFKHHSVQTSDTASTAGFIWDLSAVAAGTTDTTRIGDQLSATTLGFQYRIVSGDTHNAVRVIYFQWYPNTVPVVANILNAAAVEAQYETDQATNYKILYDRTHTLNEYVSGVVVTTRQFRRKLRIPRKNLKFLAASTTATNKVYSLYITDSAAVVHPSMIFSTRLNYTDC